ncbi:MAG: hypothetical protein U0894_19595 [Pirellulales bacterium]
MSICLQNLLHVSLLLVFLLMFGLMPVKAQEVIPADKGRKDAAAPTLWYDIKLLSVEGQAWSELAAPFDRSAKAQGKVQSTPLGPRRKS